MELNIKELLDFFGDRQDFQKGDANAVIAMLGEELNASIYKHFRNNNVEILPNSVGPGINKGKRLDRWIVDKKNNKLLQCEIKNWAATAIGGRHLKSDASDEEIKKVVEYYWDRELRDRLSKNAGHPNGVSKVLLKMKPPKEYKTLKRKPLLIYWMPISLDKKGVNPLSTLLIKNIYRQMDPEFSKLEIFSASLYLRKLYRKGRGGKFIDLDMSHLKRRMKILNRLQNK